MTPISGPMRSWSSSRYPTFLSKKSRMPWKLRNSWWIARKYYWRKGSSRWYTSWKEWQQICSICQIRFWSCVFSILRPRSSSGNSSCAKDSGRTSISRFYARRLVSITIHRFLTQPSKSRIWEGSSKRLGNWEFWAWNFVHTWTRKSWT